MVAAKLEEKEYKVQAEELPLKVWLQRGWEEETVLNCPSREDEKLGVLYSVPVRVDTWRELVRCMEEEVCELERKLKKRKQGAAETEDDGLEVAPAKAAPSKDRKAGKTAKAETGTWHWPRTSRKPRRQTSARLTWRRGRCPWSPTS